MLWQHRPTRRTVDTQACWALAYMQSITAESYTAPVKKLEFWFDEASDVSDEAMAYLTSRARSRMATRPIPIHYDLAKVEISTSQKSK